MQKPIVQVIDLHKRFGSLEVLRGVTLQVMEREVVCLIGRSGSGKSTLLRCINFLEEPDAGAITVARMTIPAGERTREHRRHIIALRQQAGMVFQSFNLFPHKTVLENLIEAPLVVKKMNRADAVAIAEDLLAKVGLAEKRNVYPSKLSGGQQQRVAIARALVNDAPLLVADEPTGRLDSVTAETIFSIFERLVEQGKTIFMVSHDPSFFPRYSRVLWIADGQLTEEPQFAR
jgi:ABC-type polar amino acid transport system ATPase subunit